MLAVQAEAATAFRRKDWPSLAALLRAYEDPSARFATAWCELEQGQLEASINHIRELFRSVRGPIEIAPTLPWTLWNLRKRFGPSALIEWGVHDALLEKLWLELTDLPVADSNAFVHEWVEPSLLAFMTALPSSVRPPLPWQLGGSMPVLDDAAWAEVVTWLRTRARAIGVPEKSTYWSLDRAMQKSSSAEFRTRGFAAFGYEISLLASERTLRQIATELDAMLLLEDVKRRVPDAAKARVVKVLFRATPKRVVDVAVVALDEPARFGALVRHVVPGAVEGKTSAELAWVEGTADDVVAAVPAPLFEAAVKAVANVTNSAALPSPSLGSHPAQAPAGARTVVPAPKPGS